MTIVEEDVRRTLHELADQGRPVDLGRLALAGARRRRRRRLGAAAVGAAALAVALPAGLTGGFAPDGAPAGEPAAHGAEQVVITYYLGGTPLAGYALDPETGDYHRDARPASSPDLQLRLSEGNGFVIPMAGGDRRPVPWPQPVGAVAWSPDSSHLAGVVTREAHYTHPPGPISAVQVVDLTSDTGWEIPLDLPPDHQGTDLFWLDQDRIAVPVARPGATVVLPPQYEWRRGSTTVTEGGEVLPIVTEVHVYTRDGTLVERIPVDQGEHAYSFAARREPGKVWRVSGIASDGAVVLYRYPTDTTMDIRRVDVAGPTGEATVTLPEPPARHYWHAPTIVFGLSGGRVLVTVDLQVEPQDGGPMSVDRFVAAEHYVVELATGRVRPADIPELPDNGRPWIYGDAAGLAPAAAHRAFAP